MSDYYKTFMKHAKKITNKAAILNKKDRDVKRPVLQGVKHYNDGSAAVTDSHRLYVVKDIHDKGETILRPSGTKVEGNYPEVSRLIPDGEPHYRESILVNEFIKAADLMLTAAKYAGAEPVVTLGGNALRCHSVEIAAKYELPIENLKMRLSCNTQYLLDALKLLKAFKYTDVELNVYSPMRPFIVNSPDDKLTTLILPVRRY